MEKIITVENATGKADTLGGELVSYKKDGREYIWEGDASHWSGHAPVLFPFVSALKNNKVKFNGIEYELKGKHGFARKSEFELIKSDESSVVFKLSSDEKTLAMYPYNFDLFITHTISENGYKTTYKVVNKGDCELPFCIGGHPGFTTDGSIEDWKLVFECEENSALYYTDAESLFSYDYIYGKRRLEGNTFDLKYEDFDLDALVVPDIKSRKVCLVNKKNGHGIKFDYSGFQTLVLWSPPKKQSPFVCLEPWNGLPAFTSESGNFTDKPYCITVNAGESYEVGYEITVI